MTESYPIRLTCKELNIIADALSYYASDGELLNEEWFEDVSDLLQEMYLAREECEDLERASNA